MDHIEETRKQATANTKQRSRRRPFIKGPIPLDWISAAAQLPGKALAVGLAIWWRRNLTGHDAVKLPPYHCLRFGVKTRRGRAQALASLEAAGLVEVEKSRNKSPLVKPLEYRKPEGLDDD